MDEFAGHSSKLFQATWSPSGEFVATTSLDWNVVIYDLSTRAKIILESKQS